MSDKSKMVPSTTSKTYKSRHSTVGLPSATRRVPSTTTKDRNSRPTKINKNATLVSEFDISMRPEVAIPDFETENKQIAYGKFLRSMLEDCLLDEKIEREETDIDKQMALLADRFQKTMSQLDKTNRRLKDISFVREQERLIQLRHHDNARIFEATANSTAPDLLTSLSNTEQAHLDKLVTKNVDFGYDKNSGYKQLLDAVNDAIGGLEDIKKHSNLDMNKFKQYETAKTMSEELELSKMDLESLKTEFEVKFPKFSEKLLKEASEKFAKMVEDEEDCNELSRQLDLWLSKADLSHGPARAIIAPHAGYSYCGACAAFAYRQVSPVVVKRIFILGPSHHVRLGGCALSSLDKYQTPLYNLTIDKQIYTELEATRQFEWMDVQTDEDEHSIEMHLPYIAKVMEEYKTGFTIIPILVGSLTPEKEAKYGSILAPYLADPQNLFVISSDFCHWGSRFRYTWRDASRGQLYQSIEWLDKQGMDIIETMDPRSFTEYLNKYGNTICGRHPIGVLLQAVSKLSTSSNAPKMSLKFLKYAQSSQCMTPQDSSVSYASASLVFE